MARPVDRVPGVGVGLTFYERNQGKGFNSHERAALLDLVLTVCTPLTWYVLCNIC